jgi:hypothetical protein
LGRPRLTEQEPKGDIQFFSETDMSTADPNKIGSSYPAWFFRESLRRLEEDIELEEKMLKSWNLPDTSKPQKMAKIKDMKERRDKILEAQAALRPNKDKINSMNAELGEKLADIMYRRSDDRNGYVNPHDVAGHWINPCIEVSGEVAKIARDNGITVAKKGSGGMLTELDAGRLWKIGRAALGEDTNVERLRRD